MSAEVLTGAAEGALKGAAVAGAVGAIVGGVVGAVSGLFKRKSRKNAQRAEQAEHRMNAVQNAAVRRNELREAFITRATAVAAGAAEEGGLQSSTVMGAAGGILSQYAYNTRYFDTQQANINTFNKFSKRSAKYADYAQTARNIGSGMLAVATRFPRTSNPAPATTGVPTLPPSPGRTKGSAGSNIRRQMGRDPLEAPFA